MNALALSSSSRSGMGALAQRQQQRRAPASTTRVGRRTAVSVKAWAGDNAPWAGALAREDEGFFPCAVLRWRDLFRAILPEGRSKESAAPMAEATGALRSPNVLLLGLRGDGRGHVD